MKNKVFLSASALLALAVTFCGCAEKTEPAESTSSEAEDTSVSAPEFLDFLSDGGNAYSVVRGENVRSNETACAVSLRKGISEKTGVSLTIKTDWIGPGYEVEDFEILVGSTNRPESEEALRRAQGGGYVICVIGTKLVINAPTVKLLESAVNDFLSSEYVTEKSASVPADLFIEGTVSAPIKSVTLNGVNIKEFSIAVSSTDVNSYGSPAGVLQSYLLKYCSSSVKVVKSSANDTGHIIYVGRSAGNPGELPRFSSKFYMKDGNVYICGGSVSDCEQAVNAFICKYLDNTGDIVLTLPDDGTELYSHSGEPDWSARPSLYTIQDSIVMSCKKLQHVLEYDHSQGKYFTYNYEDQKWENTFAAARKSNNRCVNCVILDNWALKDLGYWTSGIFNHTYDGNFGIKIPSGEGGTFLNENFEILKFTPDGKTINQLIAENNLKPGDIIFFKDHNQIIIDEKRAFDGGRGNTEKVARGSTFNLWLGPNKYLNTKVGYILRPLDAE